MPPSGDLACSPGMWPRLGMELTALWFAGWHSIRWAILARTKLSFIKLVYFPLTCCTRLLSQFLVLNVYSLKNRDISYFLKICVYASVLSMYIYIYIYIYVYLFIYLFLPFILNTKTPLRSFWSKLFLINSNLLTLYTKEYYLRDWLVLSSC